MVTHTSIFWAATAIRSCARMILATAAAISGVRQPRRLVGDPPLRSFRAQAARFRRNAPTVRAATGAEGRRVMLRRDQGRYGSPSISSTIHPEGRKRHIGQVFSMLGAAQPLHRALGAEARQRIAALRSGVGLGQQQP